MQGDGGARSGRERKKEREREREEGERDDTDRNVLHIKRTFSADARKFGVVHIER